MANPTLAEALRVLVGRLWGHCYGAYGAASGYDGQLQREIEDVVRAFEDPFYTPPPTGTIEMTEPKRASLSVLRCARRLVDERQGGGEVLDLTTVTGIETMQGLLRDLSKVCAAHPLWPEVVKE